MDAALQLINKMFATVDAKDDVAADVRECARDRGRAMLAVLRGEPTVVNALLPVVMRELRDPKKLKARCGTPRRPGGAARQLDKAEEMFRQCLARAPLEREAALYGGLLEVLWLQHKHAAVITLCKEALGEPDKAAGDQPRTLPSQPGPGLGEEDRHDEAVAEIDKAIKLAAETARIVERCARARILARAERYDAAFAECDALLKELTQANEFERVASTLALETAASRATTPRPMRYLEKILEDDPATRRGGEQRSRLPVGRPQLQVSTKRRK